MTFSKLRVKLILKEMRILIHSVIKKNKKKLEQIFSAYRVFISISVELSV